MGQENNVQFAVVQELQEGQEVPEGGIFLGAQGFNDGKII